MKRCPRCEKTYPDLETFCEADGTALVQAGPAFAEGAGRAGAVAESAVEEGGQIECPVCGGRAQPGELICNFCGARLGVESAAEPYSPPRSPAPPRMTPPPRSATTVRRDSSPSMRITGRMPDDDGEEEGRGTFARGWISDRGDSRAGRRRVACAASQHQTRGAAGGERVAGGDGVGGLGGAERAVGGVVEGDGGAGDRGIGGGARAQPGNGAQIFRRSQGRIAGELFACDRRRQHFAGRDGGADQGAAQRQRGRGVGADLDQSEPGVRRGSSEGRFGVEFRAVQRRPGRDRLSDNFHQRSRIEGHARSRNSARSWPD